MSLEQRCKFVVGAKEHVIGAKICSLRIVECRKDGIGEGLRG